LLHYRPLARKLARQYFVVGADDDDLEQEALIGLFRAARDFCPDKNMSFPTFAAMCIKRALGDAIRYSCTLKNRPLRAYSSLSLEYGSTAMILPVASEDPADLVATSDLIRWVQRQIHRQLSEYEFGVWGRFLAGMRYDEIAHDMDSSLKPSIMQSNASEKRLPDCALRSDSTRAAVIRTLGALRGLGP
jgi:RNA polymerase sporulation-specific sigma factor